MKRAKRVTQTSSDHTFVDWVFIKDKKDDEIMKQVGSSDGFLSFNMTCGRGCVVEYRGQTQWPLQDNDLL